MGAVQRRAEVGEIEVRREPGPIRPPPPPPPAASDPRDAVSDVIRGAFNVFIPALNYAETLHVSSSSKRLVKRR